MLHSYLLLYTPMSQSVTAVILYLIFQFQLKKKLEEHGTRRQQDHDKASAKPLANYGVPYFKENLVQVHQSWYYSCVTIYHIIDNLYALLYSTVLSLIKACL